MKCAWPQNYIHRHINNLIWIFQFKKKIEFKWHFWHVQQYEYIMRLNFILTLWWELTMMVTVTTSGQKPLTSESNIHHVTHDNLFIWIFNFVCDDILMTRKINRSCDEYELCHATMVVAYAIKGVSLLHLVQLA